MKHTLFCAFMIFGSITMDGFAADSSLEIPQVSKQTIGDPSSGSLQKTIDADSGPRQDTGPDVLKQPITEFGRAQELTNSAVTAPSNGTSIEMTAKPEDKAQEVSPADVAKDDSKKTEKTSSTPPPKDKKSAIHVDQVGKNDAVASKEKAKNNPGVEKERKSSNGNDKSDKED